MKLADGRFGAPAGGVRRLRLVPRAALPLAAACAVANGVREALRELLGAHCELIVGEPAALAADGWAVLAHDARLFLTRGRHTDVVFVLPAEDARRLVLAAFGEDRERAGPPAQTACSALELHALERIAARCAAAFEPLAAERSGPPRPIGPHEIPPCIAYVDLRVHAPVPLTLGVGIVRALPEPAPSATLVPRALDPVAVEARAVFAEGTLDVSAFAALRPGQVVKLETKVGALASLNLGAQRLATGVPGIVASRTAFLVHDVIPGAPS